MGLNPHMNPALAPFNMVETILNSELSFPSPLIFLYEIVQSQFIPKYQGPPPSPKEPQGIHVCIQVDG